MQRARFFFDGDIHFRRGLSQLSSRISARLPQRREAVAMGSDQIVDLEIGEPDFDTPRNIIDAGCDALHKGFTHYGPSAGLPQLRETIAQYVSKTRWVDVSPDEVVVVPGGKPIIFFTILALVEEGDEVIYPNPGFPI